MADEEPEFMEEDWDNLDLEFYPWQEAPDYGGMPGEPNPPPDFDDDDDPELIRREQVWLQSDQLWQEPLRPMYIGREILSVSSDCLVGHWSAETRFGIKHCVVKQRPLAGLLHSPRPNLRDETAHYRNMQARFQPGRYDHHIVRLFKGAVVDEGKNTLKQDVGWVERMILEYCERTLDEYISQDVRNANYMTERQMWRVFSDLAHSLLVMNHGTENPADYRDVEPGFSAVDICHFNLNPNSVYIKDHSNYRVKVGSFRRAVKLQHRQDERYHHAYHNFGEGNSRAPEQLCAADMRNLRPWLRDFRVADRPGTNNRLRSVTYSSKTNVWQVGLIMLNLMYRTHLMEWADMIRFVDHSTDRLARGGYTIGNRNVDDEVLLGSFSRTLLSTIRECLLIEPSMRPDILTLYNITTGGYAQAVAQENRDLEPPVDVQPQEEDVFPNPEPRLDPPDHPMPDEEEPYLPDPRAVVEAEAEEGLPEYQFHAPAGEAMVQPDWAEGEEGLERPPPIYQEVDEFIAQAQNQDRPQDQRPPPQAAPPQLPPDLNRPLPALPRPRNVIPRRPVGAPDQVRRPAAAPINIPRRPVGAPDQVRRPAAAPPQPARPPPAIPPQEAPRRAPSTPPQPGRTPPPPPGPPLNLPLGFQPGPDDPYLIAAIPPVHLPNILVCHILENDLFRRQAGNIYLRDLQPATTFAQIKRMLVQQGITEEVGIELRSMRLRVDDGDEEREIRDEETWGGFWEGGAILVDDPNAMVAREGDIRGGGGGGGGGGRVVYRY